MYEFRNVRFYGCTDVQLGGFTIQQLNSSTKNHVSFFPFHPTPEREPEKIFNSFNID